MIGNPVIRTRIANLQKEKADLGQQKNQILKELSEIKDKIRLSGRLQPNNPWLIRRTELVSTLKVLEVRFLELKSELITLHRKDEAAEAKATMQILREIFNDDQIQEIFGEVRRRAEGEPAQKILFNLGAAQNLVEDVDKWKKLYAGEMDKIQEVRILLNRVIEDGCKQFGDAEFLKIISPLNRYVLPLNELKKLKRRIFPRDYLVNYPPPPPARDRAI